LPFLFASRGIDPEAPVKKKRTFVGTSGWTYDDWAGRFYPDGVKGSERLSYYATQFDTVEINATFYRLPTQAMIKAWNRRLGEEFHLVVKGSRVVTHLKRIEACEEQLKNFLDRALELTRLKVILWQLPPSLHKDIERLDRFLSMLPDEVRYAVEFRHKSWWDGETADVLSKHKAAFVTVSHRTLPDTIFATTDFLYVRFHGTGRETYRYDYSDEELVRWTSNLKPHLHGRTLYAFFNNDFEANAPRNAMILRRMLDLDN
jgi:uncharacterized protein YecE (DUF72 family)